MVNKFEDIANQYEAALKEYCINDKKLISLKKQITNLIAEFQNEPSSNTRPMFKNEVKLDIIDLEKMPLMGPNTQSESNKKNDMLYSLKSFLAMTDKLLQLLQSEAIKEQSIKVNYVNQPTNLESDIHFNSMPDEVLKYIFSFISNRTLATIRRVEKKFDTLIHSVLDKPSLIVLNKEINRSAFFIHSITPNNIILDAPSNDQTEREKGEAVKKGIISIYTEDEHVSKKFLYTACALCLLVLIVGLCLAYLALSKNEIGQISSDDRFAFPAIILGCLSVVFCLNCLTSSHALAPANNFVNRVAIITPEVKKIVPNMLKRYSLFSVKNYLETLPETDVQQKEMLICSITKRKSYQ